MVYVDRCAAAGGAGGRGRCRFGYLKRVLSDAAAVLGAGDGGARGPGSSRPSVRRSGPSRLADASVHDAYCIAGDHHPRQRQRRRTSAVASYRVADAIRSVVAMETSGRDQPDRPAPRSAPSVGRHTRTHAGRDAVRDRHDQPEHPRAPSMSRPRIGAWRSRSSSSGGHPSSLGAGMKRADGWSGRGRAREARPSTIAAEVTRRSPAGELANASDVMMDHPLALQLRNLQTVLRDLRRQELGPVIFPAPLMSAIEELGAFLNRETAAARRPAHGA